MLHRRGGGKPSLSRVGWLYDLLENAGLFVSDEGL